MTPRTTKRASASTSCDLKQTCYGCEVHACWKASWSASFTVARNTGTMSFQFEMSIGNHWCYGHGGEACERSLDFTRCPRDADVDRVAN